MIGWLFRNRRTGGITIVQWPNVALGIFIGARLAHLLWPNGAVRAVGTAALWWWAVDEIVRGVNPWRRILGTAVLAGQLASL